MLWEVPPAQVSSWLGRVWRVNWVFQTCHFMLVDGVGGRQCDPGLPLRWWQLVTRNSHLMFRLAPWFLCLLSCFACACAANCKTGFAPGVGFTAPTVQCVKNTSITPNLASWARTFTGRCTKVCSGALLPATANGVLRSSLNSPGSSACCLNQLPAPANSAA